MTTTPRLGITQLEESQALPEATVNEAIVTVEPFATRIVVLSKGDNAPAGGESNGEAYLVGPAGTGDFTGHDDEIAVMRNDAWEFHTPLDGWEIEVLDEDKSYTLRGGTWVETNAASGAIEVQDEGVTETAALVSLNFTGAGVTATDDGSGNVEVAIPGGGGAGTGAMELISEQTPSSTGTVTFSSIAGTYRDLRLVVRGRGTNASTNVSVQIRFNSDSGSNYDRIDYEVDTTPVSGESLGTTSIVIGFMAAASATANVADAVQCTVLDYRGTTFQKAVIADSTHKFGTSGGNVLRVMTSGWWRSTSAITQVDVILSAGNFAAGSVVSLYGIM